MSDHSQFKRAKGLKRPSSTVSRNRRQAKFAKMRCLFLKLKADGTKKERKARIKEVIGNLCWPSYIASKGLDREFEEFKQNYFKGEFDHWPVPKAGAL